MRQYSRSSRSPAPGFARCPGPFCKSSSANVIGTNVIAKPVTRERIATLPKKQQKAWLEYLERSEKQKAIDKQTLADEQKAAGNTSPKHASGGRGMFALRAEHPAGVVDASDEALKAARNIVTYQVADGGWSKNIDMVSKPRAPGDLYDADNENRFPDPADFDKPVDPELALHRHARQRLHVDADPFSGARDHGAAGRASRCRCRAVSRIGRARRGVSARLRSIPTAAGRRCGRSKAAITTPSPSTTTP